MTNLKSKPITWIFAVILIPYLGCKKESSSDSKATSVTSAAVPAIYKRIYGASSITSDGTYLTIKTNGVPAQLSEQLIYKKGP